MRRWQFAPLVGICLLSACSSMKGPTSTPLLPVAVPLQATEIQELALIRIDQLLQRRVLTDEERAKLYYDRGLINDSLGLRTTARLDFERSLTLDPSQADLFNVLGIYLTQVGLYDEAYEAFDSALELDTMHPYAQRYRGIALYYGKRYALAERELLEHYQQDPDDPFRSIWLYLVQLERLGAEKAHQNLTERYKKAQRHDPAWQIASLYLDQISEQDFMQQIQLSSSTNQELAQKLCEAYFYLAKRYQKRGMTNLAVVMYKLAMANNVYDFMEHRYSLLELTLIAQDQTETAIANKKEAT
ncbi:MAG: lipoprotein NlpI [Enterovibrio sp.]